MSVLHSDLQYTGSDGQVLTLGVKAWLWGEELDTATWELRRLGEALFPAWGSADNKAFEGRFTTSQGGYTKPAKRSRTIGNCKAGATAERDHLELFPTQPVQLVLSSLYLQTTVLPKL